MDATLVMDELKMNREIESMTEEEMESLAKGTWFKKSLKYRKLYIGQCLLKKGRIGKEKGSRGNSWAPPKTP